MENLETYLKQKIEGKIRDLSSQYELTKSMLQGCKLEGDFIRPVDIDTYLEAYRKEVELYLLLSLYDERFDNTGFKELKLRMQEESEITKELITSTLIRLLNNE